MYGLDKIGAADLRRILGKMRCDGMTEAEVIEQVCWILNGLADDGDE